MESTDAKKHFQCELCNRTFVSRTSRNIHYRIHTGERPYECSTCGKGFRKRHTLDNHELTHLKEQRHACPYCTFRTAYASYLPMHITTQHTKDFKHFCSVCNKGFFKYPDLKNHHMKLHFPTFKCDVYNVQFDSVLAPKGYKKCSEQTEGKPHSELCPFSPDYKKGTSEYHLPPSGEQVHRCELCDRTFSQKRHLGKHLRTCGKNQNSELRNEKKS